MHEEMWTTRRSSYQIQRLFGQSLMQNCEILQVVLAPPVCVNDDSQILPHQIHRNICKINSLSCYCEE